MSTKISDAILLESIEDYLMLAVGNTGYDEQESAVTLGQVKDYTDSDKALVAFTGSYLNLSDTPNLESYVLMTTLQNNYYTKNQTNQLIRNITGARFVKVEQLPERGENNVIYLVPQQGGGQQNIFDEYVWLPDGRIFEKIGTTAADFTNYYTIEEVDALIPTVNNATITLQQGGTTKGTFTLNQSSNATINFDESFVQEQANWNEIDPTDPSYILNKPTIPTVNNPEITFVQNGDTVGTITLNQSESETITLDSQVQADWEQEDSDEVDYIKNKPETLSLIFTYQDYSSERIDFYIKERERIPNYFFVRNEYNGQNTVTLTSNGSSHGNHAYSVEYSKDKENWTTLNFTFPYSGDSTNTILLEEGEVVYFRNNTGYWNDTGVTSGNPAYTSFKASEEHTFGGDLNTLLDYTDENVIWKVGCFRCLFKDDTKLITPISLPYTTLSQDCYSNMFYGCTGLTTLPENYLPATTLKEGCYSNMFYGCTGLTTVPENLLPATTIEISCYSAMFGRCTSLRKAPNLPAPLVNKTTCYGQMFVGCTSLNEVTVYADDIYCQGVINGEQTNYAGIWRWLRNVSATGTFHNLGRATYPSGDTGIPSGWTEVNS